MSYLAILFFRARIFSPGKVFNLLLSTVIKPPERNLLKTSFIGVLLKFSAFDVSTKFDIDTSDLDSSYES